MQVCLIQVPYAMGHQDNGGSKGPQRLVEAGAQTLLEARGLKVATARVERGSPFRDTATASRALNRRLAQVVRQAHASGQLPLILAGSCDASLGIVAGFEHARAVSSGSMRMPISIPPTRRPVASLRGCP